MSPLAHPRLRYLFAGIAALFVAFALLRAGFYLWASEVSIAGGAPWATVLETLGIGLRFDLRLAILLMLPPALLLVLPRRNASNTRGLRRLMRAWLAQAVLAVALIYIVDFGHYAYLGLRLNASALRFFTNVEISADMIWQSYPALRIALAWLLASAGLIALLFRIEHWTLEREPLPCNKKRTAALVALTVAFGVIGILGRVSNINLANPVPLRWGAAFFSGDTRMGALGLNPVIFIWDTWRTSPERYDLAQVREHAADVAAYLGAPPPPPDADMPRFERIVALQPHRLKTQQPPNVILIHLESLGSVVTSMGGNPLDPTPELAALAKDSWFLRHFYVPVTGTAKTVWAVTTGTPDVSRSESASRNPLLLPQHTILNAFKDHDKIYAVGGSADWANVNALLKSSIDGLELYEEGFWKSPNIDVWGVSDLDLFRETDALLRARAKDRPFFAFIQMADNHPPFTIPPGITGFDLKSLPEDELHRAGFRSNAQYNAVRLLDFNIGRFIEMAKASGYYDNTIFVLYGDHNGRIANLPFLPPAYEALNIESLLVPCIIHAPKLIGTRTTDEASSLVDLLPTLAGLLGLEHRNTTLGRDILLPAPEGERAVPLLLREGTFPQLGVATRRFLVRMNADGTQADMHEIDSSTLENVADKYPEEFARLSSLARGLHETARLMLYSNKIEKR
ncbi:MAG: LTA synthase family protein [Azoarcus sp.]|jgi:phosphoglycerol transferase MdoB-like AlkP superfamily enzyme|nr:LTA synthase family protein [Azoarcus sp.]